jgi:hypothetical protein
MSEKLSSTDGTSVIFLPYDGRGVSQIYVDTEHMVNDLYIGQEWVYKISDDDVDDIITLLQYRQAYRKQEGLYASKRNLPDTP